MAEGQDEEVFVTISAESFILADSYLDQEVEDSKCRRTPGRQSLRGVPIRRATLTAPGQRRVRGGRAGAAAGGSCVRGLLAGAGRSAARPPRTPSPLPRTLAPTLGRRCRSIFDHVCEAGNGIVQSLRDGRRRQIAVSSLWLHHRE